MTATPNRGGALKIVSLGVLACVGCCAGPVLALLEGVSLASLASTRFIGVIGLLISMTAASAYLLVRHRRAIACAIPDPESVAVGAPTRKGTL